MPPATNRHGDGSSPFEWVEISYGELGPSVERASRMTAA